MHCPKCDRSNTKHVILVVVGVIIVLIIVAIAIFCVFFFGVLYHNQKVKHDDGINHGNKTLHREQKEDQEPDADQHVDPYANDTETFSCDKDYQKWCLDEHNELRARHFAEPLTMNVELCKKALKCAKYYLQLKTVDHSCPHRYMSGNSGPKYGENLYFFRKNKPLEKTLLQYTQRAMEGWYAEKDSYDFEEGKPINGTTTPTGHLTQMLWLESKEFGVFTSKARDSMSVVVVCLYNPPGNVKGDYQDMVLPMESKNFTETTTTTEAMEKETEPPPDPPDPPETEDTV